jgi:ferredoxin
MSDDQATPIDFVSRDGIASKAPAPTSLLAYQSAGHCLVIGDITAAIDIAERLDLPGLTVLEPTADGPVTRRATESGIKVFSGPTSNLQGHLGRFDCELDGKSLWQMQDRAGGGFDLVVDLSVPRLLTMELAPFGYHAVAGLDETALTEVLSGLTELQGEFEKPKYFEYDPSICAHSRSGITACTACIDVCSTGAITSAGEGVSFDPYLCQGCGSCATSCPTGATRYAYPAPADAIEQLSALLSAHRQSTSDPIVLLLHDADEAASRIDAMAGQLVPGLLPLAVEEAGSVGMDIWFSAFAMGVSAVLIDAPDSASSMHRALSEQIVIANRILEPLGLADRIMLVAAQQADPINEQVGSFPANDITPASYLTFNDKRQTIRLATDYLLQHFGDATVSDQRVDLPAGAPFGEVVVNSDACTLCLACVTTCPARALQDGETLPQLKLIESACVQCGTCEQACPENAITLVPGYLLDSEVARRPRVLNEEQPFNCIVCNTPFATARIISRMLGKLEGHWMFEDDKSKRRLKMCDDCRVKDIFIDGQSGIDVHRDA